MKDKLSTEHILVCEEYLKGFTGGKRVSQMEAYLAVYPDSTNEAATVSASRIFSRALVNDYIASRVSEMAMGANEILLRLANVARSADKDSDKLKAMELIGKHLGMWLDRTDITSAGSTISLSEFILAQRAARKEKDKGITVEGD